MKNRAAEALQAAGSVLKNGSVYHFMFLKT